MHPERLLGLYNRQSEKLDFAETLIPHFKRCAHEIGAFQSLRTVCAWLDENGVRPSHAAKAGAKWHHERLNDYLQMDGEEPTGEDAQLDRFKGEGMRVAIRRYLKTCCFLLQNPPDAAKAKLWGTYIEWEQRIHAHELRILSVTQKLRFALGR